MSEASPFKPALVFGLIAAGVVSFAVFVFLLAYGGGDGAAARGGRGTAVSPAAIGFEGLVQLTDTFFATDLIRSERDLDSEDLVVVALEATNRPEEVSALLRRRDGLPTVIILPKWGVVTDPDNRRWVRSAGPIMARAADRLLGACCDLRQAGAQPPGDRQLAGRGPLAGISFRIPSQPQIVSGTVEPLTRTIDDPSQSGDARPGALIAQLQGQPHYIVADPDLLNNVGIADREQAEAAVQMLAALRPEGRDTMRFDLTVNGAGRARSIIRTMLEPPFLAMTLALIAAAFLAAYHGAVRFGPARRPERAIPFGKAALVENSAGLIRVAGREARLGGGYAELVRNDAARASAAPASLRGEALDAYLDRFNRDGGPPYSVLASAVRAARTPAELVAAARALLSWKRNLIR